MELARQLGLSETAVRRAEKAGRIKREPDGAWDLARVKAAWSRNTDRAQQRRQHGGMRPVPEAAVGAVRETLREHGEPVSAGGMTFMQVENEFMIGFDSDERVVLMGGPNEEQMPVEALQWTDDRGDGPMPATLLLARRHPGR